MEVTLSRRPTKGPIGDLRLIREMSLANRLWGAPRIHGELLKLGIEVAQSTVAKYMTISSGIATRPTVMRSLSVWRSWARDHPTAARSPWQNGHAERLIGSIRRECLDHIVVFGEAHLRRILAGYVNYYSDLRTHLSLDKDPPSHRPIQRLGQVAARPILGGLHHEYCRM